MILVITSVAGCISEEKKDAELKPGWNLVDMEKEMEEDRREFG